MRKMKKTYEPIKIVVSGDEVPFGQKKDLRDAPRKSLTVGKKPLVDIGDSSLFSPPKLLSHGPESTLLSDLACSLALSLM